MMLVLQAMALTLLSQAPGAARAARAKPVVPEEWLLRPEGLGRLDLERSPRYLDAMEAYPGAEARLEAGHPGRRETGGEALFFVFRRAGEELFRSECFCSVDSAGHETFRAGTQAHPVRTREEMWIQPITRNPRYKTAQGIGVGSTIRDLRSAYPGAGALHYVREAFSAARGADSEYVCFFEGKRDRAARTGSVEMLRFYIVPSGGHAWAGRSGAGVTPDSVDPDARIIAIEPHRPCNPQVE